MDDKAASIRIGARARAIRKSRGFTLKDVGTRAQINLTTLSRIEIGERELPATALVRLARALDVSVLELLGEGPMGADLEGVIETLPHDADELRRRVAEAIRSLAAS